MKSTLILALAGSAVAAPSFSDFLDALFGGDNSNNDNRPSPSDFPGLPPLGTGSGVPFPFPTATGAPFPTGSSDVPPFPGSDGQEKRNIKVLHIDYDLAAKAAPAIKRRELKYRQLGSSALPSFSLLDPNDTPPATAPATGLPTALPTDLPGLPTGTDSPELPTDLPGLPSGTGSPGLPTAIPTDLPGLPTGGPTAPVPTGEAPLPTDAPFPTAPAGTGAPGIPSLPTTFGTVTRGPQPTSAPDAPSDDGEETQNGNFWLEWISDLLTGGKGSQN